MDYLRLATLNNPTFTIMCLNKFEDIRFLLAKDNSEPKWMRGDSSTQRNLDEHPRQMYEPGNDRLPKGLQQIRAMTCLN